MKARNLANSSNVGVSPVADADRRFCHALILLGIIGAIIALIVFFLPYDTIADEEEYLSEIFSVADGHPEGWNIRHLLYPILLSPFVAAAHALGSEAASLSLVARLGNWSMWWLALFASFQIGLRLFDRTTAWLSVVLLIFNWVWMLSGKRFMMDVPSAAWLLLAIYFYVFRRDMEQMALFAGLACAAIATATKFQMGPLAAIYGIFFLAERVRSSGQREALLGFGFGVLLVVGIGFVDWLTYGKWFSSLIEFRHYNLGNVQQLAETYGPCGDLLYYARATRDVFSVFIGPLALLGLAQLIFINHTSERMLLALLVVAYVVVIHVICGKQSRYLIAILPEICILSAAAYIYLWRRTMTVLPGALRRPMQVLAFGGICVIVYSLVPKNDVRQIFSQREACADFVYRSTHLIPPGSRLILAVPCGMPTYYLSDFRISFGDLGMNEYTRQKELETFRDQLNDARAVFVARGNPLDKELRAKWAPETYVSHASPRRYYVLYVRHES